MTKSKLFISSVNLKCASLIPSKDYSLNTNDIIIYVVYLPDFIDLKPELATFCNSKEKSRAKRYHKEIDSSRFLITRSILKIIVAAYTQLSVKEISLDYQFNKKPYLASHPWLNFNISHSEDYAVIAISRIKIGIDIEYMSEDQDYTNLLIDVFNKKEILNIENATDKKNAFYTSWTRKEAFVKALGKGIDDDFKYIPCLDGQHRIDTNLLKNEKNWQVYSFDLAEHYSAAICFEGLPKDTTSLKMYNVPNSMKELLEIIK